MNSQLITSNSVYIPNIVAPTGHEVNVEYIEYLFENIWDLGSVNRVDIFDVVNKNGKVAGGKRGAFVHMNDWANNSTTELILEEIMKTGQCQLWLTHNTNNGHGCYWILKQMNREPIPETQLNVHQLAEKLREAEAIIKERDIEIASLIKWKNDVGIGLDEYIPEFQHLNALELLQHQYDDEDSEDSEDIDCINELQVDEYDYVEDSILYNDSGPMTIDELSNPENIVNNNISLNEYSRHQFSQVFCNNDSEPMTIDELSNPENIVNNNISINEYSRRQFSQVFCNNH